MEARGKVIGKISKLSEEPPWNQDPYSEIPSLLPPGWVWLSKFHHTAKAIKSPYTEVLDFIPTESIHSAKMLAAIPADILKIALVHLVAKKATEGKGIVTHNTLNFLLDVANDALTLNNDLDEGYTLDNEISQVTAKMMESELTPDFADELYKYSQEV